MKHVSDPGNQLNNGLHQDQFVDISAAVCVALVEQTSYQATGGTDAHNTLSVKGV